MHQLILYEDWNCACPVDEYLHELDIWNTKNANLIDHSTICSKIIQGICLQPKNAGRISPIPHFLYLRPFCSQG